MKQDSKPKKYAFKPAVRMKKGLDPQACGERIEALREKTQRVDAQAIVDDAKSKTSPFHRAFTWDDSTAALQQRLSEARHLLRSITVVVITPQQKQITVSAFVAVPKAKQPNRSTYTSMDYAMDDAELRGEVLKAALRELATVRRKYAELSELAAIFDAIDGAMKKVA